MCNTNLPLAPRPDMPNLAEKLADCIAQLPEDAVPEVLDFAELLLQREASREDGQLSAAQQTAMADWDNADDDAWNNAPAV
jgi:hypothetical protein